MSDPIHPAGPPAESEPQTPMWLPALGAALFVAVGVAWAVMASGRAPASPAASAGSEAPVTDAGEAAPQHP